MSSLRAGPYLGLQQLLLAFQLFGLLSLHQLERTGRNRELHLREESFAKPGLAYQSLLFLFSQQLLAVNNFHDGAVS